VQVGRTRWPEYPKGKLEIKYGAFAPWQDYVVLETDYLHYSLIYRCTSTFGAWPTEDLQFLVKRPS